MHFKFSSTKTDFFLMSLSAVVDDLFSMRLQVYVVFSYSLCRGFISVWARGEESGKASM